MARLVLMRHGESTANAAERFGGWQDVPLTEHGIAQACAAGRELREQGFEFALAFSSLLGRSIHTCRHVLGELHRSWVPARTSWRLNERHYGALEGMSKAEAVERFGVEQVQAWRRGHDQAPPCGESLRDLEARVAPFWIDELLPALRAKVGDVLVVSHGNTLRALRRLIEDRSLGEGSEEEIPTAVPVVYRASSCSTRFVSCDVWRHGHTELA